MHIEFWTSTQYGGFMESLMVALRARGHTAGQRFLISESSYRAARSKPARLWLRVRQYLLYPACLKANLLFGSSRKADVLVVCTNTFYAPLIATFLHKRVVHLVYDLFPEALCGEAALERARGAGNERNLRLRPLDSAAPHDPKAEALVVPPDASALQGGSAATPRPATFPFIHRIIRKIVSLTLQRAEANVFLGEHLRDYVLSQYKEVRHPVVIPVGATGMESKGSSSKGSARELRAFYDGSPAEEKSAQFHGLTPLSPLTLLYCGNLGRMHDIDTLLGYLGTRASRPQSGGEAQLRGGQAQATSKAELPTDEEKPNAAPPLPFISDLSPLTSELRAPTSDLSPPAPPHFLFHCSGPGKPVLESAVAALPGSVRARIRIAGPLGGAEWEWTLLAAQAALVTMAPGAEKVVMPSKTYSAMMAGQAILAICPEPSDLADTVRKADCGWVVAPGDVSGLAAALDVMQTRPDLLARKRANARAAALEHYSMPVLAKQWTELLER